MSNPLTVYIGYDAREQKAYDVAKASLLAHASVPVNVIPLDIAKLAERGLLRRPMDTRGHRYDLHSNAAMSTDFAISRFLPPILTQSGWALFTDSDVVCFDDVAKLFALADPKYAVMCVKHDMGALTATKMDGQQQLAYPKKNWSSVMLFNCDHPANKRLSLVDIQERPGRYLHGFEWLNESEIGELPAHWNWLVNIEPKPESIGLAHFTLGGPFLPGWQGAENDEIWLEAANA